MMTCDACKVSADKLDVGTEICKHAVQGFPEKAMNKLEDFGFIQSRPRGEYHANNQQMSKLLHKAIGLGNKGAAPQVRSQDDAAHDNSHLSGWFWDPLSTEPPSWCITVPRLVAWSSDAISLFWHIPQKSRIV
jgi:hypothetical protein